MVERRKSRLLWALATIVATLVAAAFLAACTREARASKEAQPSHTRPAVPAPVRGEQPPATIDGSGPSAPDKTLDELIDERFGLPDEPAESPDDPETAEPDEAAPQDDAPNAPTYSPPPVRGSGGDNPPDFIVPSGPETV